LKEFAALDILPLALLKQEHFKTNKGCEGKGKVLNEAAQFSKAFKQDA